MYFPSRAANNLSMSVDIPMSNITVTGDAFTVPGVILTITDYAYNTSGIPGRASHEYVEFYANYYINGIGASGPSASNMWLTLPRSSGWATKSWTNENYSFNLTTSDYFNATTKNTRTLFLTAGNGYWYISSEAGTASGSWASAEGSVAVTLDAPPVFNSQPSISKNTNGYYKGVTTVSVSSSATAKYGGEVTSTTLTIGSQSTTINGNGTLSLTLNETGTFTPVVTVVDSRGQSTPKSLSAITVINGDPTTFSYTQVILADSNKTGFWTNKTTARVTISNLNVPYSGTATIKLTIGNQSVTRTSNGNLDIAVNTAGTFTPIISFTDSFGRTGSYSLNPIVVNQYVAPSINYKVYRAKNVTSGSTTKYGIKDDEAEQCILVEADVTYIQNVSTLLKPDVTLDGSGPINNITWYTTYSETNGLSNPITWTNYRPNSPIRLYALITGGPFLQANAYIVGITIKDSSGGVSTEIFRTLAPAFFTVDFLAGGHGVAFGMMAKDPGVVFSMNMPALLELDASNIDSTTGLARVGDDKDLYNSIVILGWRPEVISVS